MNSILTKRSPVYKSWIALIIFVIVLIFQPKKATFLAMYPSDGWLLFCIIMQYFNGHRLIIPFKNRIFILYYGLILGVLAILATLLQASFAGLSLNISFTFEFYRFFRFVLIFTFVENILLNFNSDDANKFWRIYTIMGIVVIVLSILEFNNMQPYKFIIMKLYYDRPESELVDYLIQVDRLAGIMGNPNTTAILLLSTVTFPLLRIGNENITLFNRIFYMLYILAIVYIFLAMTGSRTAIYALVILVPFYLIASSSQLKKLVQIVFLLTILVVIGIFLYNRFKTDFVVQDRLKETIIGEKLHVSSEGDNAWAPRIEEWQENYSAFEKEGNPFAFLIGLGYTKAYRDYSDNGFISTFINNGLIGLILKLILFYLFFTSGLLKALFNYRNSAIPYTYLAFGMSSFALLLWELTADLTEHYKLGQLFYLFLSATMITNSFSNQNNGA